MDLVSMVLGLPLLPFRGIGAVIEVLRDQAERELYDPSSLRAQAEEIDALVESGQISPDEAERRQDQMLEHVLVVPGESMSDEDYGGERRSNGGTSRQ